MKNKNLQVERQKIRVDVYSLPSNSETELRCFVDIPISKSGELIGWLLANGESVVKGIPKLKK